MNKTTTIRVTDRTQKLLKQLSKTKKMTMSSIIYNLAENEVKKMCELENFLNK